jgi:hypothetical protein
MRDGLDVRFSVQLRNSVIQRHGQNALVGVTTTHHDYDEYPDPHTQCVIAHSFASSCSSATRSSSAISQNSGSCPSCVDYGERDTREGTPHSTGAHPIARKGYQTVPVLSCGDTADYCRRAQMFEGYEHFSKRLIAIDLHAQIHRSGDANSNLRSKNHDCKTT